MPDEEEAAEAFATLADPVRIAVLRAFAEAFDDRPVGESTDPSLPVLSFSDIYDRVDVDSTSQLSYHLDELDGTYLSRTEDGWRFTFAGEAIVRLFLAGGYAGDIEFEPVEVEGECVVCGATALRVEIDDRLLFHRCGDCEAMFGGMPVRPAQLRNRDPEQLLESVTTRVVSQFRQFRNGVCGWCGGVTTVDVRPVDIGSADDRYLAVARCEQCWRTLNGPPPMWLATHPAAVAFHYDHGVDVFHLGIRGLTTRYQSGDWTTERRGDEYEITYQVGDNALRLVVDDALAVVRTERVRRSSGGDRQ